MMRRPTTFSRRVARSPLILFVAVAVSNAPAQTGTDTRVRVRMERAVALLAAEEADRAIPILLSVVDEVPHHGPARFQLGALAVERDEWEVAADHLEAAVASYGPDAPAGAVPVQRPGLAWALYSEALGASDRLAEALEATGRALRFAPDYLPALLGRSNFARRLAVRERGPGAPRGESFKRLIEISLEAARRALTKGSGRPGPWIALSLGAHEGEIPELARCAAERAAELSPGDPQSLFLVAWTSVEEDPGGALAAAEAALASGLRDDPVLWMTLGRLRAFRLDMDASLDAYREALRLDPAVAGEVASVALDAIVAGGDPELLALLQDRAARRPDALNTRFTLAKAHLREGRADVAARELTSLVAENPNHAAILTTLHAALRRTGDSAADVVLARLGAVKAAEAAAWERANAAEIQRRQAREAAAAGNLAETVRLLEAVVRGRDAASPEFAADLAELGGALEALGRHREALSALDRSLTLRPFDPETLAMTARVARTTGETEEADRYAARAVLTAPRCEEAPAGG